MRDHRFDWMFGGRIPKLSRRAWVRPLSVELEDSVLTFDYSDRSNRVTLPRRGSKTLLEQFVQLPTGEIAHEPSPEEESNIRKAAERWGMLFPPEALFEPGTRAFEPAQETTLVWWVTANAFRGALGVAASLRDSRPFEPAEFFWLRYSAVGRAPYPVGSRVGDPYLGRLQAARESIAWFVQDRDTRSRSARLKSRAVQIIAELVNEHFQRSRTHPMIRPTGQAVFVNDEEAIGGTEPDLNGLLSYLTAELAGVLTGASPRGCRLCRCVFWKDVLAPDGNRRMGRPAEYCDTCINSKERQNERKRKSKERSTDRPRKGRKHAAKK